MNSQWSPEQLVRIQYDWRKLNRSYAYHPYVRVIPQQGDPPTVYHVEYRVRTLEINSEGQLNYSPTCTVEITLPAEFPHAEPHVRPLIAIFHPNVDLENVQIVPAWNANLTLADVVERVGKLLAFQIYDPGNIWNPTAMQWVVANAAYVPTDPTANLHFDAGGDPLERVCRSGPAALPSLKDQVRRYIQTMVDPSKAPSKSDVAYFAMRTRLAASLFLDSDIPEHLSSVAIEIDDWAVGLPDVERRCSTHRALTEAAGSARQITQNLSDAKHTLFQIANTIISHPVAIGPKNTSRELLESLPPAIDLQKSLGLLRGAQIRSEQHLISAVAALRVLQTPTENILLSDSLRAVVDPMTNAAVPEINDIRSQLSTAINSADPVVNRCRKEIASLESILQWREYFDTQERCQHLTAQVIDLGAAGLQSYYMVNDSGAHGPFEFEQSLDLGSLKLAIRKSSQTALELVDLNKGRVVAKVETGDLKVKLPGETPDAYYETDFKPTPRCDDVAMQFDYAARHTQELLSVLGVIKSISPDAVVSATMHEPTANPVESWCTRLANQLLQPDFRAEVVKDHTAISSIWKSLAVECAALAPFKERIATYHLLLRASESVPQYISRKSVLKAEHGKHTARIAEILNKSSKDHATDSMIIPGKFAKEYESLIAQSDKCERESRRLESALALSAAQIKARMAVRKNASSPIGAAKYRGFSVLPEMPVNMHELADAMNDYNILDLVAALEAQLHTRLYDGKRPQRPSPTPPPPVESYSHHAQQNIDTQQNAPTDEPADGEFQHGAENEFAQTEHADTATTEHPPAEHDQQQGDEAVVEHPVETVGDGFAVQEEHDPHAHEHGDGDVMIEWPK